MRIECRILRISACLFALLCLSSVGDASPPSAGDNVHFCRVLDYEDMRERDSIYAATKHAPNLNVGEPRTVRMIYFLPNDRPFRQEVVDSMKVTIRQIQTFYAEQMQAHGHGNKTFRFETDAQDEPIVHRVDGQNPTNHYSNHTPVLRYEVAQKFDLSANIYFLVIDNGTNTVDLLGFQVGGIAITHGNSRVALIPGDFFWTTAAHELGHTFGLGHDFNDDAYIMSYGPGQDRLSECSAGFLAVHPYFNPDVETIDTQPTIIKLISSQDYPADSKSVLIQLKVSDSDGIHQVFLFLEDEVKACRRLHGEKDAVVEFDYDGVFPSDNSTSLSDPNIHPIDVKVVDTFGNENSLHFLLRNISAPGKIIAKFDAHTNNHVTSVSFSPDSKILISGSFDGTIKLWDVAIRRPITTLRTGSVFSLALSPDGTMIAIGSNHRVDLWDIATEKNITPLEWSILHYVHSVAFSPDGTMVAAGAGHDSGGGGTVRLWDVATGENIANLEGDMSYVWSVTFSPDGTTLAIGSEQGIILWDISTKNFDTLTGYTRRVNSVKYSPDGTILALGTGGDYETAASFLGGRIYVWEVPSWSTIATLEGHFAGALSVAFSPDGMILASGALDHTVRLWDVATGINIATFEAHTEVVRSVAFSPDGTILASGAGDGKVMLWDMSDYVTPVVYMPDANLHAVIRDALGKSRFAPITTTDMASLTTLDASNRNIRDLTGLEFATNLTELNLVDNWLSSLSINTHIPALQERGVEVLFDKPTTLVNISDSEQEGVPGAVLGMPLVVEVRDQGGDVLAGSPVTFVVTEGDGALSVETTVTDSSGRASSVLTLGNSLEPITVSVMVAGIEQPVIFLIEAMATPDFDRDGAVGFADFLLFVAQFGFSEDDEGYDVWFDLDGDGTIGFGDFLIFANAFGKAVSSN